MQKTHLTKKTIEGFVFAGTHDKAHDIRWDRDLRGFGVRVFPKGAKAFVFRYTTGYRRKRLITIGKVGELTLDQARTKASRLRVDVLDGTDPAEERASARNAISLNTLADRYLTEHALPKKKASSAEDDRRNLDNHIRPRLGAKPVPSITRADIQALHHAMHEAPYSANRVLALLSKMFNLAEKWGLRPEGSNPCRHIDRHTEIHRERFLSQEELKSLGETLGDLEASAREDANIILAIRLLVLTGCRLSEILTLRWSEVRLDQAQLWLQDSKTGRKAVFLPPQAIALLQTHPRVDGNPFVIRGTRPNSHLINLQKPWRRIRAKAGLAGVRLHDLRHTFASVAASRGLSLPIIGVLLGHKNVATTQRYAHLANEAAHQAASKTGLAIAESFLIEARSSIDAV